MPLDDFQGNTFVAFTDISGFKELMNDENRTLEALDTFYSAGFDCLHKIKWSICIRLRDYLCQRYKKQKRDLF